jgi:2-methylcitrate dehydratase PrpD
MKDRRKMRQDITGTGEKQMNETRDLAKFVTDLSYRDLKSDVVEKTKYLILDQLGCQLAFANMPWNQAVYQYTRNKKGGGGESTVTYYGLKTMAEDASFANATFGHGFEMDDTELRTTTHPGSVVIPAAMAMSEVKAINGKDLITAIVAGYDAMLRIGMATRFMMKRAFHTTPVLGPFGAAVAAGKIQGFDSGAMLNTLGIAGSECSGIAEYAQSGGSIKRLHAGFAAYSGVRAALLAQAGLTGPSTVLEGKRGFCQAFSDEYDLKEITADFGMPFRILWTGCKPYCCCAAQHTTIDATAEIMKEHVIEPEDVTGITVTQASREANTVGNIIEPRDIVSAQFSGRFGVALRLIKGNNGFSDYSERNMRDPAILALAKKVNYSVNEEFNKLPPGVAPSLVSIKLKNGTVYSKRVDYARGTVSNPMTGPELTDKFRSLAGTVLPERDVETIIQTIMTLDELKDIRRLSSLLAVKTGE